MKKILIALTAIAFFSCNDKKTADGSPPKTAEASAQATPEDVVNTVFNAAKTKDYSGLSKLCAADADGDSKRICEIKDEDKAEFEGYFSKGKITGAATITGDAAEVPITFGKDGTKAETMNLVKVDGKWYLKSF